MKRTLSIVLVSIVLVLSLFGQESLEEADMSIEQLYLRGPASIESMATMITSNEYEMQQAGMRALRRAVTDGRVDPRTTEYIHLMGFVLEQGVTTISKNWSNLPDSYHPTLRREAAGAIAEAGPDSVEYLVRAIRNDPEPTVAAEAMLALSQIPDIDTATASLEVALAIRREANTRRDETMLVAGFEALGNLAERTTSTDLDDVVRETTLLVITQGHRAVVTDRAVYALSQM